MGRYGVVVPGWANALEGELVSNCVKFYLALSYLLSAISLEELEKARIEVDSTIQT